MNPAMMKIKCYIFYQFSLLCVFIFSEDPYDNETFEYWRNETAIEFIFGDSSNNYNFSLMPSDGVNTTFKEPNRVVFSNLDPGQLYEGSIYAIDSDITHTIKFRLGK